MSKSKTNRIVTPKGIALWPKLNEPDYKFKAEGEYSVKVRFTAEASVELRKQLDALMAEARKQFETDSDPAKAKKYAKYTSDMPYKPHEDEEGNETGDFVVTFRQKAKITPKNPAKKPFDVKVPLFDAKGKPMSEPIWGGSTIKVSFETFPYAMPSTSKIGLSLRLCGVQVIDLVTGNGGDGSSMGFSEEDGYVAPEESEPLEAAAKQAGGDEDGDF